MPRRHSSREIQGINPRAQRPDNTSPLVRPQDFARQTLSRLKHHQSTPSLQLGSSPPPVSSGKNHSFPVVMATQQRQQPIMLVPIHPSQLLDPRAVSAAPQQRGYARSASERFHSHPSGTMRKSTSATDFMNQHQLQSTVQGMIHNKRAQVAKAAAAAALAESDKGMRKFFGRKGGKAGEDLQDATSAASAVNKKEMHRAAAHMAFETMKRK